MADWYAGLDRSGTPDLTHTIRGHNPYVVAAAAVPLDEDGGNGLARCFREARRELGWSPTREFRGHQMSDSAQSCILRRAQALHPRVGALIVDKLASVSRFASGVLPMPGDLQDDASLLLLRRFLPRYRLRYLWCDEDIKTRQRQAAFKTEVKRIHRTAWPESRLIVHHKPSDAHEAIQLADVIAYGIARLFRGTRMVTELRAALEAIVRSPDNEVVGPTAWGG